MKNEAKNRSGLQTLPAPRHRHTILRHRLALWTMLSAIVAGTASGIVTITTTATVVGATIMSGKGTEKRKGKEKEVELVIGIEKNFPSTPVPAHCLLVRAHPSAHTLEIVARLLPSAAGLHHLHVALSRATPTDRAPMGTHHPSTTNHVVLAHPSSQDLLIISIRFRGIHLMAHFPPRFQLC